METFFRNFVIFLVWSLCSAMDPKLVLKYKNLYEANFLAFIKIYKDQMNTNGEGLCKTNVGFHDKDKYDSMTIDAINITGAINLKVHLDPENDDSKFVVPALYECNLKKGDSVYSKFFMMWTTKDIDLKEPNLLLKLHQDSSNNEERIFIPQLTVDLRAIKEYYKGTVNWYTEHRGKDKHDKIVQYCASLMKLTEKDKVNEAFVRTDIFQLRLTKETSVTIPGVVVCGLEGEKEYHYFVKKNENYHFVPVFDASEMVDEHPIFVLESYLKDPKNI